MAVIPAAAGIPPDKPPARRILHEPEPSLARRGLPLARDTHPHRPVGFPGELVGDFQPPVDTRHGEAHPVPHALIFEGLPELLPLGFRLWSRDHTSGKPTLLTTEFTPRQPAH